jgi:uncharacterized protein (DUF305 family)
LKRRLLILLQVKTKKAKAYAKVLEKQAKEATAKQAAERPPARLSATDIQFCERLIQKHGLDYEAMARDHENIFQNTAKQLERKIKTFQRSTAYKDVVGEQMEA